MTKTILTPDVLIAKRDNIISEIKKSWQIIQANNVFITGKSKFDIKKVYESIQNYEMELVKVKVAIQAANFGLSKLSDLPANCAFTSIFTLSQVKERMTKLNLIPTKKEDGESVAFTRNFIDAEIKSLNSAKEKIEKELATFNSTQNIEI